MSNLKKENGMKKLVIGLVTVAICTSVYAQDKKVKFSNITEVTFGFQVGKTTQIQSVDGGGDNEVEVAGYKFPAPRVSSSFGALFGDLFFLGPGLAYTFQPSDNNGTALDPNANQHKLSAFGHARIHFAKGRFRSYAELKGGYTHIFTEEVSTIYSEEVYTWDGAFAEPAIGFGFKLGGHGQVNASLGYQFLNVWNRSDGFTSTSAFGPELKDAYHRLLLSFGFSFY
ncbi:MAG: hypothetical protein ACPG5W_05325 [Flavobacteriales bacterium]